MQRVTGIPDDLRYRDVGEDGELHLAAHQLSDVGARIRRTDEVRESLALEVLLREPVRRRRDGGKFPGLFQAVHPDPRSPPGIENRAVLPDGPHPLEALLPFRRALGAEQYHI